MPAEGDGDDKKTPLPQKAAAPIRRKSYKGIILALFALIVAGGGAAYYISTKTQEDIKPPIVTGSLKDKNISEADYIRIGWQADAHNVLGKFIAGKSVKEKLPYINNADQLHEKMEQFYGGVAIDDEDTPDNLFAVKELSEDYKKRGIFMFTYEQPPRFAPEEFFKPLAPLDVRYGVEGTDSLLNVGTQIENFSMEPVRVHALFKRTSKGLRLDWEVFAQSKYRIFRNFTELPHIGQPETFRVIIVEDTPEKSHVIAGYNSYRIMDPAYLDDSVRINVSLDSDIGKLLSTIDWRGTDKRSIIPRTATIELVWTDRQGSPALEIKRFICWEFLGLGGVEIPAKASSR